MSAAAVEQPFEQPTLLEVADRLIAELEGHRVEIIGSQITVTPPANSAHSRALSRLMRPLFAAGLDEGVTNVLQAVGVWLPDGPSDYAIPDLAVVEADIDDHLIEFNCYDPSVFRMVLEVTSSNLGDDLRKKPLAYAAADIPIYVIVDRTSRRVLVLTEPRDGEYRVQTPYRPGQRVDLPASIGAEVSFEVDAVLGPEK
jgi:hypothetical protein